MRWPELVLLICGAIVIGTEFDRLKLGLGILLIGIAFLDAIHNAAKEKSK